MEPKLTHVGAMLARISHLIRPLRALGACWPSLGHLLVSGCNFGASGNDFGSLGLPPGRPGPRFSKPKRMVFQWFSVRRSVQREHRPTSIKYCKNQYETHFGHIAQHTKNKQKTIVGRPEHRSARQTALAGVLGRLGNAPERPRSVHGAPRERLGASRERPGASREHPRSVPGASPERPRSDPRHLRASRQLPGASRDRFGVRFGSKTPCHGTSQAIGSLWLRCNVVLRVHTCSPGAMLQCIPK